MTGTHIHGASARFGAVIPLNQVVHSSDVQNHDDRYHAAMEMCNAYNAGGAFYEPGDKFHGRGVVARQQLAEFDPDYKDHPTVSLIRHGNQIALVTGEDAKKAEDSEKALEGLVRAADTFGIETDEEAEAAKKAGTELKAARAAIGAELWSKAEPGKGISLTVGNGNQFLPYSFTSAQLTTR